jgi:hypothetical protein
MPELSHQSQEAAALHYDHIPFSIRFLPRCPRLQGSWDETWRAIEYDYYMPTECMLRIDDLLYTGDYILCPTVVWLVAWRVPSSRGMGGE